MGFPLEGACHTPAPRRLRLRLPAASPAPLQVFRGLGSLSPLSALCLTPRGGHRLCAGQRRLPWPARTSHATFAFSPSARPQFSLPRIFSTSRFSLPLRQKTLRLYPYHQKRHQKLQNKRQVTILNRLASQLSNLLVAWCVFCGAPFLDLLACETIPFRSATKK